MLPYRSHWRFAFEQAPEREARLLAFANGGGLGGSGEGGPNGAGGAEGGQDGPEQAADPLANNVAYADKSLNPDGTPIKREGVPVQEGRDETRTQVADVMGGGDAQTEKQKLPESANAVLAKAIELKKRMDGLHDHMHMLDRERKMYLKEKPELMQQWEEYKAFLATETGTVLSWINDLSRFKEWEDGKIHPQRFRDEMTDQHRRTVKDSYVPRGGEREREDAYWALNRAIADTATPDPTGRIPDLRNRDVWDTIDASSKITAIRAVNDKIGYKNLLKSYNDQIETWDKALTDSKLKEFIDSVDKVAKDNDPETQAKLKGGLGWKNGLFRSVGIEFYSVNQIIEAFGQVKEAVTQSWDQKRRLKAARLAKQVGGVTELIAKGSSKTLDSNLDSKNREIRNSYKEYLQSQNLNFRQLFVDSGNEMDKNTDDPNRAQAILEYAASKGWLYKLADVKGADWNRKLILGKWYLHEFMPDDDEAAVNNYFGGLLQQNEKGAVDEASAAKAREQTTDNPNEFIKAINRELQGVNIWAAKGIMERAFERGLKGEISALITTTFMRHLRNNTGNMREHISTVMLDQIGIIAAYTPAPTLGAIKFDKNQILKFAQTGSTNIKEAGRIGEAIGKIEEDILAADPSLARKPDTLDALVAQVLGCNTVEVNGKYITIFSSPRYDFYNEGPKQQGNADIGKLDEDFFRQRSEVLMSDPFIINAILDITGDGNFKDAPRAGHFLSRVHEIVPELTTLAEKTNDPQEKQKLLDAADRFLKTMGNKLDGWMAQRLQSSRSETLASETLGDQQTPAMLTLIDDGFIKMSTIEEGLQHTGKALAISMIRICALQSSRADIRTEARRMMEMYGISEKPEEKKKKENTAAKPTPPPTPPSAGAQAGSTPSIAG